MKKILLTVVLGVAVGAMVQTSCAASSGTIGRAASSGTGCVGARARAIRGAGDQRSRRI